MAVVMLCAAPLAMAATTAAKAAPTAAKAATTTEASKAAPTTTAKAEPAPAKTSAPATTKAAEKKTLVDINTATKEELMMVPGIGDATAAKIIAGRPFKTKHDLVTRKIMNQGQYAKASASIIAKQK
jgi:DNA uptake protein ComE-like DNA-binding protein